MNSRFSGLENATPNIMAANPLATTRTVTNRAAARIWLRPGRSVGQSTIAKCSTAKRCSSSSHCFLSVSPAFPAILANPSIAYFNEHGPDGRRLAVARAKISDVRAAARSHTVTAWHKYRDGSWDEDGLTGLGSAVLPDCKIRAGHPADLHADAAYNRAVGMYMITRWCFGAGVGRLYMHMSRDGAHFEPPYLVDEEPGQWMPYSTFMAHEDDQETNDMSTVDVEFYILIDHKSAANYGIDTLYRRKITVARK